MKIKPEQLRIIEACSEHADDWTRVFIKGLRNFRWISKYLREQNINEVDISLSFQEDVQQKTENEQFLIAYYRTTPVGIIRFDNYFFRTGTKILSHFPLVVPRFQGNGIGSTLVQVGVSKARQKGLKDIWAECWSKDHREIAIYRRFYEKNDFQLKSIRMEMSCLLKKFNLTSGMTGSQLETVTRRELTEDFVQTLSESYARSSDKLHTVEKLSDVKRCREFLTKTAHEFEKEGFIIKYTLARMAGEYCGALMTATTTKKGIILEIGILPTFRRRKIAQAILIDYLIKIRNKGAEEVILAVDEHNQAAINLYKKIGFKKTWSGIMLLFEPKE